MYTFAKYLQLVLFVRNNLILNHSWNNLYYTQEAYLIWMARTLGQGRAAQEKKKKVNEEWTHSVSMKRVWEGLDKLYSSMNSWIWYPRNRRIESKLYTRTILYLIHIINVVSVELRHFHPEVFYTPRGSVLWSSGWEFSFLSL